MIARHVHGLSGRAEQTFVAINCGAFSETLVESELFGYEKGAFTGAQQGKPGWFETASGGTLFLDEIGDLPLAMQVKLLRVLQEREVVRLGARRAIPIDVRLIAATNVDLAEAVRAGRFREDLYYRLQVIGLPLRPLRERPGDIMPLTRHFMAIYAQRLHLGEVERMGKRHPPRAARVPQRRGARRGPEFVGLAPRSSARVYPYSCTCSRRLGRRRRYRLRGPRRGRAG